MKKICVVTGSRAEYGILSGLLAKIKKNFKLQLIVTGSHLSKEFGLTYKEILDDGFKIDYAVPILKKDGVCQAMGRAISGIGEALKILKPDLVMVLGDRYEVLAAAEAALLSNIPVAHIAGGDLTEGSLDDNMRHAITQLSSLHFVTNEQSLTVVKQLGAVNCFNVGHIALDKINDCKVMSRDEFQQSLKFELRPWNILVTYHPETNSKNLTKDLNQLIAAISVIPDEVGVIATAAGADKGGDLINKKLASLCNKRRNSIFVKSLGQKRFFAALKYVDAMVGNSSSGIYEVPSFKIPTVNIGNRQKGRIEARSIINCDCDKDQILAAIEKACSTNCHSVENPYGDGKSCDRIIKILASINNFEDLLKNEEIDAIQV